MNDEFFNNINGYSLDYNQRKIVLDESNTLLVIAGAGSGKTLTMVSKIKFLIEKKHINPKDILCISFTNETVNNLKEKINYDVNIYTFHKLGLKILKSHNIYYQIAPSDLLEYIVNEYFESSLFYEKYLKYILSYFNYLIEDNNISIEKIKNKYNKLFISYKKLIIKFINILKCNDKSINDIRLMLLNNKIKYLFNRKESYKNKCFFVIVLSIYKIYLEELNSYYTIDFDMMIDISSKVIDKYGLKKIYKYIIIDEFQDTSYIRYNLINKIKEESDCKLVCVGDDFQSIYRFSGCNLDLFINFKRYFINSKILYMTKTYRNSLDLLMIANKFILKNRYQIRKYVISDKRLLFPIKIVYYTKSNYKNVFFDLLEYFYKENKKNILVLGRCNYDIKKVYDKELNNNYIEYKDMNVRYLTVHKSKGLECDNVIVLNLVNDVLGFPNQIEDDKVLNLVLKSKEKYLYAEERRLFYVALTRTKNSVYLMTMKNNESIFIKEIKNKCEVLKI